MKIYEKVAKIKLELQQRTIAKSGKNTYAKFKYHELKDFLHHINELNAKYGVDDTIEISMDHGATLTLTDIEDGTQKITRVPYGEAQMLGKGGSPSTTDYIQRVGATITYLRRYLYMTAYNIVENDIVDSLDTTPQAPIQKATETQCTKINGLLKDDADRKDKMLKVYGVKNVGELTMEQASQAIKVLSK